MKRREWIRLTGSLGFINLFSILFGFLYNSGIARFYGAQALTDAYVVAIGLPDLLGSIFLLTTLPAIITPIFAEARESGGETEAWKITSQIVTLMLAVGIVASGIVSLSAERLIPFLSPGLNGSTLIQTIRLTKLLFPTLILSVFKSVLLALLNLRGRFALPSLIAVLSKVIETALLFFLGYHGRIDLLVALVWFDGIFVAVIYWFLLPDRRRIHWAWGWSPAIQSALGSAALLTLITFLGELHGYSYRWFGSFLPTGSIALYYYASRFMPLCLGFFSLLVGRPLYPTISAACARKDWNLLQEEMQKASRVTLFLLLPMMLLLWVGRDAMLSILFYHGKFSREDLTLLSQIVLILLPAIGAQCAAALFSNVLMAGRWIAQLALVVVAMDAVLFAGMAFGVMRWGVLGLAVATAISSVITLISSIWVVRRLTVPLFTAEEFAFLGRLVLAGLCFAGITKGLAYVWQLSPWVYSWRFLTLEGVIFAVVYPSCLHLFGVHEIRILAEELLGRMRQGFRPSSV